MAASPLVLAAPQPAFDSGWRGAAADARWHEQFTRTSRNVQLIRVRAEDADVTVRLATDSSAALDANAPGGRWGREFLCLDATKAPGTWHIEVSPEQGVARARARIEVIELGRMEPSAAAICNALAAATQQAEPGTAAAEKNVALVRRAASQLTDRGELLLAGDAWLAASQLDYAVLSNWSRSADSAQHALQAFAAAHADSERADALFALGGANIELAKERSVEAAAFALRKRRVAAARVALSEARRLFKSLHRPRAAARASNDLAMSFFYEAEFAAAERAFAAARAEANNLQDRTLMQLVNANLATVLSKHGEPQRAAEAFNELLNGLPENSRVDLRLTALHNSANPYLDLGDFDAALQRYLRALDLSRSSGDSAAEARALQGIGRTYHELGEDQRAASFLQHALQIRQRTGDSGGTLSVLVILGEVRRTQGDLQAARLLHEQAAAVPAAPAEAAKARLALSLDFIALGDGAASLRQLDTLAALAIDELHPYRLAARLQRASSLRLLGRNQEAIAEAAAVAATFGKRHLVSSQIAARVELQRALRAAGDYPAAMQAGRQTAALFERSWLAAGSDAIRLRYRASREAIYQEWVAAVLAYAAQQQQAGRREAAQQSFREALAAANSGRAHELQGARAAAPQPTPAMSAELQGRYAQLAGRFAALERAAERSSNVSPTMRALEADIAELQVRVDAAAQSATALRQSQRPFTGADVATLQQRMLPGQLLVFYQSGDACTWQWLMTRDTIRVRELAASRALQGRMTQALQMLGTRTDPAAAAVRLAALAADLGIGAAGLTHVERVAIVADAGLAAWPWTYLWNQRIVTPAPIAVEMLATLPSSPASLPPRQPRVLLFGDPIYSRSDQRIAGALVGARPGDLASLPGTARELEGIAAALRGLELQRFQGGDATRARFLGVAGAAEGIVHLATHGFDNAREPALSRLVFSTYDTTGHALTGDIRAGDLAALRWRPWLVVLSSCDSAAGETLAGEGVMSMVRTVLMSGARHVVGALWAVADARTASLMREFYLTLRANNYDVAKALAVAQRSVLASEGERALPDVIAFSVFSAGS